MEIINSIYEEYKKVHPADPRRSEWWMSSETLKHLARRIAYMPTYSPPYTILGLTVRTDDNMPFGVVQIKPRSGIEFKSEKVTEEFVPFAFEGYPDNPVYLHPCGTVIDVVPTSAELLEQISSGDCDCESGKSWVRIYVKRK